MSAQISERNQHAPLIHGQQTPAAVPEHSPPTYVERAEPMRAEAGRVVTVNAPKIILADLIGSTLSDYTVEVGDNGVDLRKEVSIAANAMPLADFFDYLAQRTGYEVALKPGATKTLVVSSVAHRSWNLATLATNRKSTVKIGDEGGGSSSGGGGGGVSAAPGGTSSGGQGRQARRAAKIDIDHDEDEWESTVDQLKNILQVTSQNGASGVMAIRSIGLVEAYGPPPLIHNADRWLSSLTRYAGRSLHMSLSIHEVALNDSKATGVEWGALTDGVYEAGKLLLGAEAGGVYAPALSVQNAGALTIALSGQYRDDSLRVLFNFLSQFGKVTLLNQPNLTVVNGRTASLSSGQEFSYVESVISTANGQGQTTITPVLARILVGVEFAITPRILDDDRILIDVVPVVTALQDFQDFSVGDTTFQTPRIAVNELATQVIVRSGQTVHLGGLITDRLAQTINKLPTQNAGMLDTLFKSVSNQLERRELVLTLTPQIT